MDILLCLYSVQSDSGCPARALRRRVSFPFSLGSTRASSSLAPCLGGPLGWRGREKFCAPILERIWDYSADFVLAWGYAVWQRWQAMSRRLGGLHKCCARASLCQGQPGWLQASLQDAVSGGCRVHACFSRASWGDALSNSQLTARCIRSRLDVLNLTLVLIAEVIGQVQHCYQPAKGRCA